MKNTRSNFAFIDSQNVNLGVLRQGWRLDWKKFRKYLLEKYGVMRAYVFLGFVEGNQDLYDFLEDSGYILKLKETVLDVGGKVKGNCDADLVLQVMIDCSSFEKAIVVSGDGDLASLLSYLLAQNKLEKVIVPNLAEYSALIKKAAPNHIDSLNHLQQKLAYIKKRPT